MRRVSSVFASLSTLALVAAAVGCGGGAFDDGATSTSGSGGATSTPVSSSSTGIVPPLPSTGAGGDAPRCGWSRSFGDAAEQTVSSVAVAPSGNIVMAGVFGGTVNFGGGDMVDGNPDHNGPEVVVVGDGYVASFDASGAPLFQRQFGSAEVQSMHVTTTASGDIFLYGSFYQSIDLGDGHVLTAAGGDADDAFVARFTATGELVSAQLLPDPGGNLFDRDVLGVAMDPSGDAYVWGLSWGRPDDVSGEEHLYTMRVAPSGEAVWVRDAVAIGGLGFSIAGNAASALPGGGVALAISYTNGDPDNAATLAFDGDVVSVPPQVGAQTSWAAIIAAYDGAGAVKYVTSFPGAETPAGADGYAIAISVAPDGTLFGAGYYSGTVDLGTGPMTTTVDGTFFMALDPAGALQWARTYDGLSATVIVPTSDGGFLATGSCDATCDLGTGPISVAGGIPAVAARFDASGAIKTANVFGPGDAYPTTAAIDRATGAVVLAGDLHNSVSFCDNTLWSAGQDDAFIARLDSL